MLTQLIIASIESALSFMISHHITDHKKWHALYDQPILLRLENPDIRLYCILSRTNITLRPALPEDIVNVSITTDTATLIAICRGEHSRQKITIQGHTATATLFNQFIRSFQPNYEGMLAPIVGESTAYAVVSQLAHANTVIQENLKKFHQSSGEYIQHECQLTPSRRELKKFYRDVDQLVGAIDILTQEIESSKGPFRNHHEQ